MHDGFGGRGSKKDHNRWYLVGLPSYKNLAEAVQKALAHCGTQMRKDRQAMAVALALSSEEPLPSHVTSDGQPYSAHQTERYERYRTVRGTT